VNISLQKGRIELKYKKYFGGKNDVLIESSDIKGIQSKTIQSRRGTYALISICLINGNQETLYFAHKQYNRRLVAEYSKIIAKTFASVTGVVIISDDK
jgi:hypothetical protein